MKTCANQSIRLSFIELRLRINPHKVHIVAFVAQSFSTAKSRYKHTQLLFVAGSRKMIVTEKTQSVFSVTIITMLTA